MSNHITLRAETKEMVRKYSEILGMSMSECIETCFRHCVEEGEVERGLLENNPEFKNLYEKNFRDKEKAYLDLLKMQKDLELRVSNLESFKKEVMNGI